MVGAGEQKTLQQPVWIVQMELYVLPLVHGVDVKIYHDIPGKLLKTPILTILTNVHAPYPSACAYVVLLPRNSQRERGFVSAPSV